MISKYITIYYFDLKCTTKGDKGNIVDVKFDINDYLHDISQTKISERARDIKGDKARLEDFDLLLYKDKKYHSIVFSRLSEFNTLRKATLDKNSEGIELKENEYIDKQCSIIYDNESEVIVVQNNIGALTYKGIGEYLTKTYKNGEYNFELIPILAPKVVDRIKAKKMFRRVRIKLDNITQYSILDEETKSSVMISVFKNCQKTGARTGVIDLSMSYDKKNNLNSNEIIELVDDLTRNQEYVGKAEFIMRKEDADEEEMTVLNFLQINLADKINIEIQPRKPLSSAYVLDQMVKKVYARDDYLRQSRREG